MQPARKTPFPTFAAELLQLSRFVRCGICSRMFHDPVELKCTHVFCATCIQTHKRERQFFHCPICSTKVSRKRKKTDGEQSAIMKFIQSVAKVNCYSSINFVDEHQSGHPPNSSLKTLKAHGKVASRKPQRKSTPKGSAAVNECFRNKTTIVKTWLDCSHNDFSRQSQSQVEECDTQLDSSLKDLISVSQSDNRRTSTAQYSTEKKKEKKKKPKNVNQFSIPAIKRPLLNELETPVDRELFIEQIDSHALGEQTQRQSRKNKSPNLVKCDKRKRTEETIRHNSAWIKNNTNFTKKLKVNITNIQTETVLQDIFKYRNGKHLQSKDLNKSHHQSVPESTLTMQTAQNEANYDVNIKRVLTGFSQKEMEIYKTQNIGVKIIDRMETVTSEEGRNTASNSNDISSPLPLNHLQDSFAILLQHFKNFREQCQRKRTNDDKSATITSSILSIIDKNLASVEPNMAKINDVLTSIGRDNHEDAASSSLISESISTSPPKVTHERSSQTDLIHVDGKCPPPPSLAEDEDDEIWDVKTQKTISKSQEKIELDTYNGGFTEIPLTELLDGLDTLKNLDKSKTMEECPETQPQNNLPNLASRNNERCMFPRSPVLTMPTPEKAASGDEDDDGSSLVNQFVRPDFTLRFDSDTQQSLHPRIHSQDVCQQNGREPSLDKKHTFECNNILNEVNILNRAATVIDACNQYLETSDRSRTENQKASHLANKSTTEHNSNETASRERSTLHNIQYELINQDSGATVSSKLFEEVDIVSNMREIILKTPEKKRPQSHDNAVTSDEDVIYATPEKRPLISTNRASVNKSKSKSPNVSVLTPYNAVQNTDLDSFNDTIFISRRRHRNAIEHKENTYYNDGLNKERPAAAMPWNLSPISLNLSNKSTPKFNNFPRSRVTSTPNQYPRSQRRVSKDSLPITATIENEIAKSGNIAIISYTRLNACEARGIKMLAQRKQAIYRNVCDSCTTHLVVSTIANNCVRDHTIKYVYALAAGIWVVNLKWVQDSIANNRLMSEECYEVKDMSGIEGPKLARLARLQSQAKLLDGFKVYVAAPIESGTTEEVANIVRMLGGVTVSKMDELLEKENYICIIITEVDDGQAHKYEHWLQMYKSITVDLEWLSRSVGGFQLLSLLPFSVCSDQSLENLGYPSELLTNECYSTYNSYR